MTGRRRQRSWRNPLSLLLGWGFAARLAFATSALIIAACLALGLMLVQRDFLEIHRNVVDRGRTISEFLAREAELSALSGDVEGLRALGNVARAQRDVLYCRFFDAKGEMLASVGAPADHVVPPRADLEERIPIEVTPELWEFQAPIVTTALRPRREELQFLEGGADAHAPGAVQRVGTVSIGIDLGTVHLLRRLAFLAALFFTTLVALAAVLSAVLLARTFTRPLRALADAADRIAQGDLTTVVQVGTGDEVAAVADSFNAMVESLAQSRTILEEYSRTLEERAGRLETLNAELAEVSRLKSEFLAQVSHELRTPLNVIMGYAHMLADGAAGEVSAEQSEMLGAILRYSRHQLDLVTDVLDLSRLASGKISFHVERFALEPLLAETLNLHNGAAPDSPLKLTLDVDPDVPELETDRVKVQEIVRNLVDNAVKFTTAGTIGLVSYVDGNPDTVVIEVRDTGTGIAPEALEYIFDEFRQVGKSSTRSTHGVGLGLSIVKRLAEALGGRVSVTSRLGEGSTFRVEIPRRFQNGSSDDPTPAAP
jgi:signal transduction histidine kinase